MTVSADTSPVPGVRIVEVTPTPEPTLRTGVPVFLGYAGAAGGPVELTSWPAFGAAFGSVPDDGHLAAVVHAFFAGGGRCCHVVGLDPDPDLLAPEALARGLASARDLADADLVCAPDVMRPSVLAPGPGAPEPALVAAGLQAQVLADCRGTGGRFALLDTVPGADVATVLRQRTALDAAVDATDGDDRADGALYHPWTAGPGPDGALRDTPPCGHVAAVVARTDADAGVHRAPANRVLDGVADLRADLSEADAAALLDARVNGLTARPGRGIRVWGARTLSPDPDLRSVPARRVLLTTARWIERFLDGTVFEPDDLRLQVRIVRELSAYLEGLHARGALRGRSPEEAFFVRCDAAGEDLLVTTVGLALTAPVEFVVLRVARDTSTSPSAVPA